MNHTDLFDPPISCPSEELKIRFDSLVGMDKAKERLAKLIGVLINPKSMKDWIHQYYPDEEPTILRVLKRPPLIVLEGDVGSGKTELATTIGDAVARNEKINIKLLSLSLTARGRGNVGEMTQLITHAFSDAVTLASKYGRKDSKASSAVILLVDEADALVQTRENTQMHHEDRAGVNAFIRAIDNLGHGDLPIAVIMCTNRMNALDPAVKRRAAEIFKFGRPTYEQRKAVLRPILESMYFTENELESMTEATGKRSENFYGFTYSDLIQRLLPTIILDAYPNQKVDPKRALQIAQNMQPTPPFQEASHSS